MANSLNARNDCMLNAWQYICMESEWHFNQAAGQGAPFLTSPDKSQNVYIQYERDQIARYLQTVINKVASQLHYWPRPRWFDEIIPLSMAVPTKQQPLTVTHRKLIALGQRTTTVIQAAAPVVYSASGTLGAINDTASITVATTVSIDEIQVFYQVSDFAGTSGYNKVVAADERTQIEPLTLVDNGNGTITITGSRALFVKPSEWLQPYQAVDPNLRQINTVDPSLATGFVTAVDVYRVYNDTTNAVQVLSADGTVLQSYAGEILDPYMGIFRIGDLGTCDAWVKLPTRVHVYYYSGQALENGQMDSEFAEGIVSFANAQMNERYSSFSSWTLNRWERDQFPMVSTATEGNLVLLTPNDAKNPFGLRRGEVRAWHMCMDRTIQQGGKLTRSVRYDRTW